MRFYFLFFTLATLSACSTSKKTVKPLVSDYDKKVITVMKQAEVAPPLILNDSVKTPLRIYTTPNFNIRKPNFVILHHTAQNSCDETLRAFQDSAREVSAHYLICKDGTVHHLLNDYLRAWHAGKSKWGNLTDLNSASIGIELDNNGKEAFPDVQITALLQILGSLRDSFAIPQQNFIGHADIAPTRKTDPSVFFPWKTLAGQGFGRWYADTSNLTIPSSFDPLFALRIIGYDISKPNGAYQAFRIHFLSTEGEQPLRPAEQKVLYAVMREYLY